jgi:hypothetical protein
MDDMVAALTFAVLNLALPAQLPPELDLRTGDRTFVAETDVQRSADGHAHWRSIAPAIIYSSAAEADLVTTTLRLRRWRGQETDPLPLMQHEYGRQAWAAMTVSGLLLLDRHLVHHHHSRWARALRVGVIVWQAGTVAGNCGALGQRSWLQALHLAKR